MSRAALAFTPTIGYVEPGRDAYLRPLDIQKRKGEAVQWWTFGKGITTLRVPGNAYLKSYAGFTDHTEQELDYLLDEYAEHGVERPGGYADVFHHIFKSPRVPWSPNALFVNAFCGAWQHAAIYGSARGVHRRYDLRSAYLWAGSVGLPDTDTYSFTRALDGRPAVYRLKLWTPIKGLPHPFDTFTDVIATTDEIKAYGLPVREVIGGVTWSREINPTPMVDAVKRVSTWKQAGRAYWGRWASMQRVQCHTPAKSWPLPSMWANFVWAHLVVSRVKMRLWEASARAVHVFVDAVITPDVIRTGPCIGDWVLQETYPNGVMVRGAGWYGPLGAPLQKMAGIRRDSIARSQIAGHIGPL